MITIAQLEEVAGPAKEWAGRCYELACCAAQILGHGHAVYGHFLGEVHESSLFSNREVIPHGWVLLPDGSVLDPTRWEFEGKEPYLHLTDDLSDYDEGGNQLRMNMHGGPPAFDSTDEIFKLDANVLPDSDAWNFIEALFNFDYVDFEPGDITLSQLHWLANYDPHQMEGHAQAIYKALGKLDLLARVPLDNRRMTKREEL